MQSERLTGRTGIRVPAKAFTTVVSSGWAQERMLENGCMLQTQEASSATCMSSFVHDMWVNPKMVEPLSGGVQGAKGDCMYLTANDAVRK